MLALVHGVYCQVQLMCNCTHSSIYVRQYVIAECIQWDSLLLCGHHSNTRRVVHAMYTSMAFIPSHRTTVQGVWLECSPQYCMNVVQIMLINNLLYNSEQFYTYIWYNYR